MIEPASLPQSTIVVVPKPLPMNRSALWTLFFAIGLLAGLFARDIMQGPGGPTWDTASGAPGSSHGSSPAPAPVVIAPTLVVQMHAVLELPSPTPTATPRPTAPPTADPYEPYDPAHATPGRLYRSPFSPGAPTMPTPWAACGQAGAEPGALCVAPTPTPGARPTPTPGSLADGGETRP